jgi:ATP-dependent RNA helicase DOB1
VLNMLRVEDSDPLKLIRSSFHQFQQERDAPVLEKQAVELRAEAESIEIADEKQVRDYTTMVTLLSDKREELKAIASQPKYALPFLQAGRMVEIMCSRVNWGWGVIVNVRKMNQGNKTASLLESNWIRPSGSSSEYVIDVLMEIRVPPPQTGGELGDLAVWPRAGLNRSHDGSEDRGSGTDVVVVHVNAECVAAISAVKLALPQNLQLPKARASVQKSVAEVQRRFLPPAGAGIPLLDITKDLGVPEEVAKPYLSMCAELTGRIEKSAFHASADKDALLDTFDTKTKLLAESAACLSKAKESQSVVMKRVLRRMDFTTTDDVLALKGRFSCELSTGDELVLTNLVFDGAFNDLTVAQVVSLLSCFVFKEENKDTGSNPRIRADMQAPYRQLQAVARSVAKVCLEIKLITDEEEYVDAFNPGLVDVAYAWW